MSDVLESTATVSASENPLLKAWQTPFETPPFTEIEPKHFMPAFEQAFADHSAEIAAITNDPAAPDFANTITALERSGKLLSKVAAVFYDLVSAHSNPALLEIDKEVSLRMARHWNPIMMNAVLFGRIAALRDNRATLGLTRSRRACWSAPTPASIAPAPGWTSRRKRGWRRSTSGWRISAPPSAIICSATSRTGSWNSARPIATGCPNSFVAAAKAAAEERGMAGKAVMTLSRSFVEPFLKSSTRRDLREKVFKAFTARGDNGNANDNNDTIVEILGCARRAQNCSASRPSRPTGWKIPWPRRRRRCAACWSGCGNPRAPGRWRTATRCRRWSPRRAAILRWRRGTGASTPKSCGSSAPISTTRRSSLISCSTT